MGLYHLTEQEVMSWYGFAKKIFEEHCLKEGFCVQRILPVTSVCYPSSARRQISSVLDISRIVKNFKSIFH